MAKRAPCQTTPKQSRLEWTSTASSTSSLHTDCRMLLQAETGHQTTCYYTTSDGGCHQSSNLSLGKKTQKIFHLNMLSGSPMPWNRFYLKFKHFHLEVMHLEVSLSHSVQICLHSSSLASVHSLHLHSCSFGSLSFYLLYSWMTALITFVLKMVLMAIWEC